MLNDCVEYQGFTQLNARIDARNASIYAVSGVFVVRFRHVSAMRAKLLYRCIAKSKYMVEMHYLSHLHSHLHSTYLHYSLIYSLSLFAYILGLHT
jgi:hypothetical protein